MRASLPLAQFGGVIRHQGLGHIRGVHTGIGEPAEADAAVDEMGNPDRADRVTRFLTVEVTLGRSSLAYEVEIGDTLYDCPVVVGLQHQVERTAEILQPLEEQLLV